MLYGSGRLFLSGTYLESYHDNIVNFGLRDTFPHSIAENTNFSKTSCDEHILLNCFDFTVYSSYFNFYTPPNKENPDKRLNWKFGNPFLWDTDIYDNRIYENSFFDNVFLFIRGGIRKLYPIEFVEHLPCEELFINVGLIDLTLEVLKEKPSTINKDTVNYLFNFAEFYNTSKIFECLFISDLLTIFPTCDLNLFEHINLLEGIFVYFSDTHYFNKTDTDIISNLLNVYSPIIYEQTITSIELNFSIIETSSYFDNFYSLDTIDKVISFKELLDKNINFFAKNIYFLFASNTCLQDNCEDISLAKELIENLILTTKEPLITDLTKNTYFLEEFKTATFCEEKELFLFSFITNIYNPFNTGFYFDGLVYLTEKLFTASFCEEKELFLPSQETSLYNILELEEIKNKDIININLNLSSYGYNKDTDLNSFIFNFIETYDYNIATTFLQKISSPYVFLVENEIYSGYDNVYAFEVDTIYNIYTDIYSKQINYDINLLTIPYKCVSDFEMFTFEFNLNYFIASENKNPLNDVLTNLTLEIAKSSCCGDNFFTAKNFGTDIYPVVDTFITRALENKLAICLNHLEEATAVCGRDLVIELPASKIYDYDILFGTPILEFWTAGLIEGFREITHKNKLLSFIYGYCFTYAFDKKALYLGALQPKDFLYIHAVKTLDEFKFVDCTCERELPAFKANKIDSVLLEKYEPFVIPEFNTTNAYEFTDFIFSELFSVEKSTEYVSMVSTLYVTSEKFLPSDYIFIPLEFIRLELASNVINKHTFFQLDFFIEHLFTYEENLLIDKFNPYFAYIGIELFEAEKTIYFKDTCTYNANLLEIYNISLEKLVLPALINNEIYFITNFPTPEFRFEREHCWQFTSILNLTEIIEDNAQLLTSNINNNLYEIYLTETDRYSCHEEDRGFVHIAELTYIFNAFSESFVDLNYVLELEYSLKVWCASNETAIKATEICFYISNDISIQPNFENIAYCFNLSTAEQICVDIDSYKFGLLMDYLEISMDKSNLHFKPNIIPLNLTSAERTEFKDYILVAYATNMEGNILNITNIFHNLVNGTDICLFDMLTDACQLEQCLIYANVLIEVIPIPDEMKHLYWYYNLEILEYDYEDTEREVYPVSPDDLFFI